MLDNNLTKPQMSVTFYIFQYLWNSISCRPSMLFIQVSKLPSMLRFLPKCTCSTHFIKHASDMTLMSLEQLGIPECISSRPATAAAMAKSKSFKILMCKYDQKFTRLMCAVWRIGNCVVFFLLHSQFEHFTLQFRSISSDEYWINLLWEILNGNFWHLQKQPADFINTLKQNSSMRVMPIPGLFIHSSFVSFDTSAGMLMINVRLWGCFVCHINLSAKLTMGLHIS